MLIWLDFFPKSNFFSICFIKSIRNKLESRERTQIIKLEGLVGTTTNC